MRTAARTLALVLVPVLFACGTRAGPGEPGAEAETVLEVDNQANLDMTIYAVRDSGQRVRLGTATAHLTSRFTIPSRLLFGITTLRFLADPIGSDRTPVSQSIAVEPGDTIVLRIPSR